jgi:hypothetical protein
MTVVVRRVEGLLAWRTALGTALAIVLGRPELWLVGALSVAARGGLLLLMVPVLTLPSPTGLTIILGPEVLAASSPALATLITAAVGVAVALLLTGLALAATADLMAYERFVRDLESLEARAGREPRQLDARSRLSTVASLALIQAVVLLPAIVAAVVLGERAAVLIPRELLDPSSSAHILARIVVGAWGPIVALIVLLLAAEMVGSLASRRLLASRFRLAPARRSTSEARSLRVAVVRALTAPLLVVSRSAGAWLITGLLVLPVAGALLIAWEEVRRLYLSPITSEAAVAIERSVVTVAFAALWIVVTLMSGVASAIRGALWTAASLR